MLKVGLQTNLRGRENKCEENVKRRNSTVAKRKKEKEKRVKNAFLNAALGFGINPEADRRPMQCNQYGE